MPRTRGAARLLALLYVAGLCVAASTVRPASSLEATVVALRDDAIAAAPVGPAPLIAAPDPAAPPRTIGEPFGLTVLNTGPMAVKWRRLQPAILLERQIIAACRGHVIECPPAALHMIAVVDAARGRASRARLGAINRAVNLAIRPQSDPTRFGATDVWSTPLMTFAAGAGDCEDYAIAKYAALREAGMNDEDLRLVVVHNHRLDQEHAVLAARVDNEWLILDNRHMVLLTDAQLPHVTPLIALDSGGAVPFTVAGGLAAPEMVPVTY